ncbi:MAG: insulinase family protein [Candidatus Taylorbacteria bacterium]|nr:insulinase family protein [Candidatus Taylorbacteria bacterium]
MKQTSKNTSETEYLINGIDPYDFTKEKVGNIDLYTKHVSWSTCTYIQLIFSVGAMHDPVGKEGLAHFLEHMMFAGTPTYPSKFEIDQFSKVHTLDSLQANTSFVNTVLHFRCLPEALEHALIGTLEMVTSPLLKEEDVSNEAEIITQEAWGIFKNETRITYRKKEVANIFKNFPDRQRVPSPIGWPETIKNITREDLVSAQTQNYVQQNLSVVLSGKVTKKEKSIVTKLLSRIPKGKKARPVFIPKKIDPAKERVWIHTYDEMGMTPSKQAYVEISYGRELKKGKGKEGAYILGRALVQEILFQELRHKNSWCYEVGAGFGNAVDFSYGEMRTKVDAGYILEAASTMRQVVKDIVDGKYKKEFEQEKQIIIERKRAVELVTSDVVDVAAGSIRQREKIETRKEGFRILHNTTYKDIQKLLKGTFLDSNQWIYDIHVPEGTDIQKICKELKKTL